MPPSGPEIGYVSCGRGAGDANPSFRICVQQGRLVGCIRRAGLHSMRARREEALAALRGLLNSWSAKDWRVEMSDHRGDVEQGLLVAGGA